ncbi:McrB family protein, partial [Acinetobacter lactucae]|uniref:McrB family protein n=1 Tax=Acinetobacter lactucae TaxID=1785128 RepID=UPI001580D4FA
METRLLSDLDGLINKCRKEYEDLAYKGDIHISAELAALITKYLENGNDPHIRVLPYSIEIVNKSNLKALIPSTWLWIANCFWPLVKALETYKATFDTFIEELKAVPSVNEELLKKLLKNIPLSDLQTSQDFMLDEPQEELIEDLLSTKLRSGNRPLKQNDINQVLEYRKNLDQIVKSYFKDSSEQYEYFNRFLYNREWWFKGGGKTLDRTDYCESSLLLATQMIVANAAKLYPLTSSFANHKDLRDAFDALPKSNEVPEETPSSNSLNILNFPGENTIFYGAPGTGKSFAIDEITKRYISVRTVFHPETQYGDFVGCLRPSMDDNGIEYSFKKGPFIEALLKALKDPEHHYYLIIEEINRAPAAAVFGELFQVLDRDKNGESEYRIDINDKDLLNVLNKEHPGGFPDNKLYIPNNLSLYATMNSSDQAVMPLDTAFKRRWKFEYMPLDFSTSPSGYFKINTESGEKTVSWSQFAQAVNSILSTLSIPEDRHLGPWFVNENEISDQKNAKKTLTGKVLMYIWDDVLRHSERSALFNTDI